MVLHGTIAQFFPGRLRNHQRYGYGFIDPDGGGPQVYFAADALQGMSSVPAGAECTYVLVKGRPGFTVQAANVRLQLIEPENEPEVRP